MMGVRGGLHFVAFSREGGAFRFYNASPDEPCPVMGMAEFLTRFAKGPLIFWMADRPL